MNWADAWARVPSLLSAHIQLSAAAIFLGLVLALPLGILAARHLRFGRILLGFASLVQTIPSLALLALFYPLLLALSSLFPPSVPLPALGFLPSLLALTLYALLPIIRNLATALTQIDGGIILAADAMGMTPGQKLKWVEMPLALPALMDGIRIASVWTIGAATLATTVGQPSLGNMIFSGLQTQNWVLVLVGCMSAAGLALMVDGLLAMAGYGLRHRGRAFWLAPVLAMILVPMGLYIWPATGTGRPTVTVGAKNFSEQFILARLIGHRLEQAGYRVQYKENLGSAIIYDALSANDVDIYVEYSGTLWANAMGRTERASRQEMAEQISAWVRHNDGVRNLGALGFENAYALAMRGDDARRLKIRTIADLARHASSLTMGSDVEFLDRPEWASLRDSYSLKFGAQKSFSPTFMYDALKSGAADVISAFSSDGRIAADGLAVLSDPNGAIISYDALLLAGPKASADPDIIAAMEPLIGHIPVEMMRQANLMVDGQGQSPDAAAGWLERQLEEAASR